MVSIVIANPADYMPSIREMLKDNWAETGLDFEFNPDVEMYRKMHDTGMLFAVMAIEGDKVVGYCTVAMMPHQHNPNVLYAGNDALFVTPAHRNGLVPGRLIKTAEREAKRRGAQRFSWHCRAGTPFADSLIRHGYQPVDIVVMKEI